MFMEFQQEKYLNKLHSDILSVMDEIDRICRKYDLKYYLIGGTLLGAVRHGGFIPWDDDLDIVMPREDMNKFIDIAAQELQKEFQLEWFTSKKYYYQYFPKVSLKNTVFYQSGLTECCQSGIFVDVFPLDLSPTYTPWLDRQKKFIRNLYGIRTARYSTPKTPKLKSYTFLSYLLGANILDYLSNRVLNNVASRGKQCYANFGSQYLLKKQTMPVEWYGEGVDILFNGHTYVAPVEKEKILNSIFGERYMQLPPIDKRRTHYPSWVKFSDGSIIKFEEPIKRLTVKEQDF